MQSALVETHIHVLAFNLNAVLTPLAQQTPAPQTLCCPKQSIQLLNLDCGVMQWSALLFAGGKDVALVLHVPVTLGSDGVLSLVFFGTTDQATVAGAPQFFWRARMFFCCRNVKLPHCPERRALNTSKSTLTLFFAHFSLGFREYWL